MPAKTEKSTAPTSPENIEINLTNEMQDLTKTTISSGEKSPSTQKIEVIENNDQFEIFQFDDIVGENHTEELNDLNDNFASSSDVTNDETLNEILLENKNLYNVAPALVIEIIPDMG